MRERKTFRIDTSLLPAARKRAGLPEDAPEGLVIRIALAQLAGVEVTPGMLDTKGGRGSETYLARRAARLAAAEQAQADGVRAA